MFDFSAAFAADRDRAIATALAAIVFRGFIDNLHFEVGPSPFATMETKPVFDWITRYVQLSALQLWSDSPPHHVKYRSPPTERSAENARPIATRPIRRSLVVSRSLSVRYGLKSRNK